MMLLVMSRAVGFQLLPSTCEQLQSALKSASENAEQIRCPFWRRRATDVVETGEGILQFLAARHKSLAQYLPSKEVDDTKRRGRALEDIAVDLEKEFSDRQYYTTGRLDYSLYTSNAFFDAPDPDMPVRSPRKFADALRGLFDPRHSTCTLLDLQIHDHDAVALWRLDGVLRLPWRPRIKPFVGETTYHFNDDNLIDSHVELWSIPAADAFLSAIVDDDFLATVRPQPAPPLHVLRNDIDKTRNLIRRPHSSSSSSSKTPQ